MGSQMPDVVAALCTAAPQKLQGSQEITDALWAMADAGSQMPDVFEALCTTALWPLSTCTSYTACRGVVDPQCDQRMARV